MVPPHGQLTRLRPRPAEASGRSVRALPRSSSRVSQAMSRNG